MSLRENLKIFDKKEFILMKDKRKENLDIAITKRNFCNNVDAFLLKQTHSDNFVFISTEKNKSCLKEGDGIITNLYNFPIAVKTADCLAIFIYSLEKDIIGVCHSGWRSTAKKIIQKMLHFLINHLQLEKKYLNFILGPAICEKCYEVKDDMKKEFLKSFGKEGLKYFKNSTFNLKKANIDILYDNNIEEEQIFNLNKCTVCNNDEYFSFRKEKTDKRILNIIKMEDKCL